MPTLMIYGATGFSGGLIADLAEAALVDVPQLRVVLAARDGDALLDDLLQRRARMGRGATPERTRAAGRLSTRNFALDDRPQVLAGLRGVDVLVNAAGPFALTADRLAKCCLEIGCHYVDIDGEVDVYNRLDDLARYARLRHVTLVVGAGHAAMTDLLLDRALRVLRGRAGLADDLQPDPALDDCCIRFHASLPQQFSRGSVESGWGCLREQVTVLRSDADRRLVQFHEAIGRLERSVDFGSDASQDEGHVVRKATRRIVSAVNMVDTLVARFTVEGRARPRRVETYLEMGAGTRLAYQAGGLLAPLAAWPLINLPARLQLSMLPDGPDARERRRDPHRIVLEIEDRERTPVIRWCVRTDNVYDATAIMALRVGVTLAVTKPEDATYGWLPPSRVLVDDQPATKDASLAPTWDDLVGAQGRRWLGLLRSNAPVVVA